MHVSLLTVLQFVLDDCIRLLMTVVFINYKHSIVSYKVQYVYGILLKHTYMRQ